MGNFACYCGSYRIPEEKKEEFSNYMMKILNYGGMMELESVTLYGCDLALLVPVDIDSTQPVSFSYNYFEDDVQETAIYDPADTYLNTEKIGCSEFDKVVLAAYTLYEMYDAKHNFVIEDEGPVEASEIVAWLNNLLGTKFTIEKRIRHIGELLEKNKIGQSDDKMPFSKEELMMMLPLQFLEKVKGDVSKPVPGISTAEFLRMDCEYSFIHTPRELENEPDYFVSDDDRLYWWDGSDEVIISENMDSWLKELSERHARIMSEMTAKKDKTNGDEENYLEDLCILLEEVENYYNRVFPFRSMFYEFIQNGHRKEFRAAAKLLRKLHEENKKDGEAIENLRHAWRLTSRKVTFNPGRLRMKRYMSVMANQLLRKKYFGF